MENYDNLFEQQPEQTEQPFDREAWAQQKREQRQELYGLIEEMSEKTLTDPSALSDYLNMQARLGKTSVANTLLVVAQKPDATFIANYDDWQKRGRSVKRGEKAALVLEANGEYERPDGTMGVNFGIRHFADLRKAYSGAHRSTYQNRAEGDHHERACSRQAVRGHFSKRWCDV